MNIEDKLEAEEVATAFLLKIVMDINSITCLSKNIEAPLYLNL